MFLVRRRSRARRQFVVAHVRAHRTSACRDRTAVAERDKGCLAQRVAVVEKLPLADLRRQHRGPVIGPEDGMAFDAARTTFNGMLDRRPALVTRPLDVDDVVAAVLFATAADLPIAVRGGGHGVAGHCVGDGSVVVRSTARTEYAVTIAPA